MFLHRLNTKYHIGCSGYYYPSWKNKFYPEGMKPKDWLQHYSSVFNTVELNGTFYRTPKLSDLYKYANTTPDDFTFSVKMSRYITHVLRLKNSRQYIDEFQKLVQDGLADKLSYFLFQLPPSFHYNEENLERILSNIPHNSKNVIELRHASWWNDAVQKAFTDAHLTFCNVDFPGLASHFINTTQVFYLRLHGSPDLFKSSYDKQQLKKFYTHFPKQAKQFTIYFNNTAYEAAYTNALQLMKIVERK
jgi:uncharacterized protein YecE (DUF72 family)